MVPVLSKTTIFTWLASSQRFPLLRRIPVFGPAVYHDSGRCRKSCTWAGDNRHWDVIVRQIPMILGKGNANKSRNRAKAITIGTNTLKPCRPVLRLTCSTKRMIWEKELYLSRFCCFKNEGTCFYLNTPITSSPTALDTGILSPVNMDSSMISSLLSRRHRLELFHHTNEVACTSSGNYFLSVS